MRMNQDSPAFTQRRSFLARMNSGFLSLAAMTGVARAQTARPRWEAARHDKDDWLDKNQAKHRVLFDSKTVDELGDAIVFTSNVFTANRIDYGLESSDLAVVVVLRHRSAPFGYNDSIWAKYGEVLSKRIAFVDPKTKQPPKINVYETTGYGDLLLNRDTTLASLAKLGTQFAVCQLSTRAISALIASATGRKADEIFSELSANLIANARLVPAGIVAVNRAQERGYTLMT
jgi:intracellular sulfur oxidation DsrE/DsrF family protein